MKLPFFAELDKAQSVLIAGARGGFDVSQAIETFQATLPQTRAWKDIPG